MRGFFQACEDIEPTKRFIVYNGKDMFPLPNGVIAISLIEIMKSLETWFDYRNLFQSTNLPNA
jgi:hypothetical protein